jgi:hypothetical protein
VARDKKSGKHDVVADDTFLRRGLIELANEKKGHLHVFEADDGTFVLKPDPPKDLSDALDAAAKGDPEPLKHLFERRGFGLDGSALLAERITKRGRGRPVIETPEKLYEERLKQIKKKLRRDGVTGRVDQKAIEILQAEDHSCRAWGIRTDMDLPDVDWDTFANRRRRSKQPRKKTVRKKRA